jgi:hypothetical protein
MAFSTHKLPEIKAGAFPRNFFHCSFPFHIHRIAHLPADLGSKSFYNRMMRLRWFRLCLLIFFAARLAHADAGPVPRPSGALYLKLRDDPAVVNMAVLPITTEPARSAALAPEAVQEEPATSQPAAQTAAAANRAPQE